jgi:hypothetical protein
MKDEIQLVAVRLTRREKMVAIEISKRDAACRRPDCGSVTHGIRVSLELAERELLNGVRNRAE